MFERDTSMAKRLAEELFPEENTVPLTDAVREYIDGNKLPGPL